MTRRKRLPKVVERSQGSLTGYGSSITAAKADLAAKVAQALEGVYTPLHVVVPDSPLSALLWRTLEGWQYRIMGLGKEVTEVGVYCLHGVCGSDAQDRDVVEQSARFHLAQCIFDFDGRTGLDVILDRFDRTVHTRWVQFQYQYRAWKVAGASDTQAHYNAGIHGCWPSEDSIVTLSADGNTAHIEEDKS